VSESGIVVVDVVASVVGVRMRQKNLVLELQSSVLPEHHP
ncbi:hypothetical protein Tco_0665693, partial [Tanacetum coccineum]